MGGPPRIPVWLPWDQRVIYFVTICVQNRTMRFSEPSGFRRLQNGDRQAQALESACGDPDARPHARFRRANARSRREAGEFSAAVKRWMRQELSASWNFQPGCFDRLLRSDESLHDKWLYVRENPVRAGLVEYWSDWPYQIGLDNA